MMTSEIKVKLAETITPIIVKHQEARKLVTDAIVEDFMARKKLEWYVRGQCCLFLCFLRGALNTLWSVSACVTEALFVLATFALIYFVSLTYVQ